MSEAVVRIPENAMNYRDPQIAELYDVANPRARDTDFYVSLAGERPCRVLDLGCGTGTLCCALAKRGHRVTGVDPAAAMLALARKKPHAEKVEWVESSAQGYRSQQLVDLIVMTGHAFQCLLNDADVLAVLEIMRGHLRESGRIAFETRNPVVDWAKEWDGREREIGFWRGEKVIERLKVTSREDEFISFETSYSLREKTLTTSSILRFLSREQVEAVMSRAGLLVREVRGDWDGSAFEANRSREMIFIGETD